MPSLLDIRRRIRAVKSTQQITKAMKMVAASKLRRAQERVQQARPFATQMRRVLNSLATRVDPSAHPLLDERHEPRSGGRTLLFVITADRGLCGSFNTNVIKAAGIFIAEDARRRVALGLVGRRGRDYFARRGLDLLYERINLFAALKFEDAQAIAKSAIESFTSGDVDSVYLVYNEFKSVMQQQCRDRTSAADSAPRGRAGRRSRPVPRSTTCTNRSRCRCSRTLIPNHVEIQVYRALLESNAAFFAAQMTAMDAATRNSGDMIDSLTLYMNKVRQAAITREIIEVVSGAQAQR